MSKAAPTAIGIMHTLRLDITELQDVNSENNENGIKIENIYENGIFHISVTPLIIKRDMIELSRLLLDTPKYTFNLCTITPLNFRNRSPPRTVAKIVNKKIFVLGCIIELIFIKHDNSAKH